MTNSTLLATPHPGLISASYFASVIDTITYERSSNNALDILPCLSGPDLFKARNKIVSHFLNNTTHHWLWFVDADMGFLPATLSLMRELSVRNHSDGPTPPVISALYFGQNEISRPDQPFPEFVPYPHMYRLDPVTNKYRPANGFDTNALIPVDAVGAGCLLIHRSVLEILSSDYPEGPFAQLYNLGEDFSFCRRLSASSIPLYVHTGLKTSHHKSTYVTESSFIDYWTLQKANEILDGAGGQ